MRGLISFILLFTSLLSASAQENYLLWEVKNSKNKLQGYLYGTVHSADARLTKWDMNFLKAFEQCKYVAGELKMEDVKSFSMNNQINVLFMEDTLLSDLLDSTQCRIVMDTLGKYLAMEGAELEMFKKVRPALVSITLQALRASVNSLNISVKEELSNEENGVVMDEFIQLIAKEHEKQVFGLETVTQQFEALYGGTLQDQAQELYLSVLKPVQKVTNDVMDEKQLVEKYLEQDLQFFAQLLSSDYVTERMYNDLFLKRNITMVDSMIELMSKKKTFVAVGAGHLAGDRGIIALLREKGYKLTPVPFEFLY